MYIVTLNCQQLFNISVLNYVTKTFVEILLYYVICLDTDDVFEEINKQMNVIKVDFFFNINDII